MTGVRVALGSSFLPSSAYQPGGGYSLLPLRFIPMDDDRYVATNFAGEHLVLPKTALRELVGHRLDPREPIYDELKSRHFLLEGDSTVAIDLLAAKYRTKQSFLENFTSLFMFVTTLRCDQTCRYCQVSRQSQDRLSFDMTTETADRALDFMFKSPSPTIKVEFQGGESLLNFEIVQHIVRRSLERNEREGRDLTFVLTTNLSSVTSEHLEFCRLHDIQISTSLDGPRELHNRNRPHPERDSYERVTEGIRAAKAALGDDRVSALMTTTEASLEMPSEIVDEYVRQGFTSIFLRSISPYGFALRNNMAGYHTDRWLDFYKAALAHIIDLNEAGVPFREEYASIILRKILTPYATGYVDLQSPAGIGISAIVFNYDGQIYASDESRMLAEMGDSKFRIGDLMTDDFADVMLSDALLDPLSESIAECVPTCADCGLLPYCGSDPVRAYAVCGDTVDQKATSAFCRKNMGVMLHLIRLLEDDPRAARVLRTWV